MTTRRQVTARCSHVTGTMWPGPAPWYPAGSALGPLPGHAPALAELLAAGPCRAVPSWGCEAHGEGDSQPPGPAAGPTAEPGGWQSPARGALSAEESPVTESCLSMQGEPKIRLAPHSNKAG